MNRIHIALFTEDSFRFADFSAALRENANLCLSEFKSAEQVWESLGGLNIDVAVVAEQLEDISGLQFIKMLVPKHPFITCALLSPLSPEDFHQATEGYGVCMHLPVYPARGDAYKMIKLISTIHQQLQS